ncbi:MAG TPA: LysR family transcriptional regulator [Ornithinibacter sp.]|nr:LysR family transcriptional regulator [Ornithinibacter sp.]
MHQVSLVQLASFMAVVTHGGVSAAARHLSYSQSSVTLHIQGLEHALDAQLFHRERGRLHLTDAGRRLSLLAPTLLSMADSLSSCISERVGSPVPEADAGRPDVTVS